MSSKGTELATVIDGAVSNGTAAMMESAGFSRALLLAGAVKTLRDALGRDDAIEAVLALKGSALGFLTDEGPKKPPYSTEKILDAACEAMLRGAMLAGNEFNVIAGRAYLTQAYYARMLRELDGLSEFIVDPGIPKSGNGGMVFEIGISWTFRGKRGTHCMRQALKGGDRVTIDSLAGKCRRRGMKWLYEHLTGCFTPDGEVLEVEAVSVGDGLNGQSGQDGRVGPGFCQTADDVAAAAEEAILFELNNEFIQAVRSLDMDDVTRYAREHNMISSKQTALDASNDWKRWVIDNFPKFSDQLFQHSKRWRNK